MKAKRRGVEMRIILDGQFQTQQQVDPALLKGIARARCWFEEVASGRTRSLVEIARREGLPSATSRGLPDWRLCRRSSRKQSPRGAH